MITPEEEKIILQYVDDSYYDRDKLIKYLSMHDIVGNEVFAYCDRKAQRKHKQTYSNWLDDDKGYSPLPVSQFVKRIPFYFYTKDIASADLDNMGTLHYLYSANAEDLYDGRSDIENIYSNLEYAFYHLELPLNQIFSYWINQTGVVSGGGFFQWCHYLHLCEEFGYNEYFPARFITAYNELLEIAGMPPIIYEINMTGLYEPFVRDGRTLRFEGHFPCDKDGLPIMKWIGIKATNIKSISCTCQKSKSGYLYLEISPNTIIYALNYYNRKEDENDEWYQVYAGPLTMRFDHTVLKDRRKELGYSQEDVASAIDTTVRTYQKWESGETTPNGHYLIRLMNWLNISNVQDVIEYTNCE